MVKLRKGELKFYKTMNPSELNEYLQDFPQNEEYVKEFNSKYKYNWTTKEWKKRRTV